MKLNHFFESSVDMLCIANYEGYFVNVNPSFIKLLGYSKEELFSRKINEFVFEEDRATTDKIRSGIHKNVPLIHFQNRYVSKSGRLVWLSWSAVPIDDEKLVYAIAKDITHEQGLKTDWVKEMTKLKNVNQDLIRLNYTTSHDLRAPVNNLLSLFELLDLSQIKDKETIKLLSYMEISARGVKDALENYLDLIQNAGKNINNLTEIHFERILHKTKNTLSSLLSCSNTEIRCDFSKCESVVFDKDYMESIFLNLFTNSVKYARPGFPPRIELTTKIKEGQKELIYRDYGQGFDMEKNGHKIFGLHQRFNEIEEGKGVGLYLIHSQITSLGGNISVESEPGKGATFYLNFPI
ncbi:sensor histidine kinase [Maribacter sp. X9]|uniref:sensor histidine kinase n=1 Tax=Maribacter sp. X9 TaxID=3402159 RepID=UPI003AF344D5